MIKKTFLLDLSNICDLQNFVNDLNTYVIADVDAMVGRYVVDAKSVLGMMSICNRYIRVGGFERHFTNREMEALNWAIKACDKYESKREAEKRGFYDR